MYFLVESCTMTILSVSNLRKGKANWSFESNSRHANRDLSSLLPRVNALEIVCATFEWFIIVETAFGLYVLLLHTTFSQLSVRQIFTWILCTFWNRVSLGSWRRQARFPSSSDMIVRTWESWECSIIELARIYRFIISQSSGIAMRHTEVLYLLLAHISLRQEVTLRVLISDRPTFNHRVVEFMSCWSDWGVFLFI